MATGAPDANLIDYVMVAIKEKNPMCIYSAWEGILSCLRHQVVVDSFDISVLWPQLGSYAIFVLLYL